MMSFFAGFDSPIQLEYLSGWAAAGAFVSLAIPIVLLGRWSLEGLGTARKWVAILTRLNVLLLTILILGGVRWERPHKDVQVIALADTSDSTRLVKDFPGPSLQRSVEDYLLALSKGPGKRPNDTIGLIHFQERAMVDALPATTLRLEGRSIANAGNGTDPAAAIQLALATMSRDAKHRLLLLWDGNATSGDLDAALSAASSQGVPIDVMPLRYNVTNEVVLDRIVAPSWKRENEPFTIDVYLSSTNVLPVTGNLTVTHGGDPMDLDPAAPGIQATRRVTLKNGTNVEHVRVPALGSAGVHQFRASVDVEGVTTQVGSSMVRSGDTNDANNAETAFTFVRGKGQVLYLDNAATAGGAALPEFLSDALAHEGITLKTIGVDQFPNNLVELQNYDAVVMSNVPRGEGGLSNAQDKLIRAYVQETGGGLVVIGGPDALGAGNWIGSEVEKALPVDMEVPSQRQVPKGALVLVIDRSGSMSERFGNMSKQEAVNMAAILALEGLSTQDLVGVVAFDDAAQWIIKLQPNNAPRQLYPAMKQIGMGAGTNIYSGLEMAYPPLANCDAMVKHVILLTDGMSIPGNYADILTKMNAAKITVSTIGVGNQADDKLLSWIAQAGHGQYYRVTDTWHLPQVFIKEARLVRRTLIHEDEKGMPVRIADPADEVLRGFNDFPSLYGMVLTSKKNDPRVEVPLTLGKNADPVLAHWQTGLGQAAVFTADAQNRWAKDWVGWGGYAKFWAQVLRRVARPPMSGDFDVSVKQAADGTGKIVVEAAGKEGDAQNFLSIAGTVLGPDMKEKKVRLTQTGPGTYEANFEAHDPGSYVVAMNYRGRDATHGGGGLLLGGMSMSSSPEMRDLKSNEAQIQLVAQRTGGRVFTPFDSAGVDLFSRAGLRQTASSMPVWDILIPFLLGLIILDVSVRRIAWDFNMFRRLGLAATNRIRSFTLTRKVESQPTLAALKRVRDEAVKTLTSTSNPIQPIAASGAAQSERPDPKAKFVGNAVDGDITVVVGGAIDKPIPQPRGRARPNQDSEESMGGLMAAKRRARQQIEEKQKDS